MASTRKLRNEDLRKRRQVLESNLWNAYFFNLNEAHKSIFTFSVAGVGFNLAIVGNFEHVNIFYPLWVFTSLAFGLSAIICISIFLITATIHSMSSRIVALEIGKVFDENRLLPQAEYQRVREKIIQHRSNRLFWWNALKYAAVIFFSLGLISIIVQATLQLPYQISPLQDQTFLMPDYLSFALNNSWSDT